MNKKIGIILFSIFVISRLAFTNIQNIFFDSGEYLQLFSNTNFVKAIYLGHSPPHEGYLILFWPIFQVAKFLHLDPIFWVVVGQILLAFLTIYCFYQIVNFIADKRTALLSSIIASLMPLFWITNVTIMMEIAYIGFFFFSLYFLTIFLTKNSKKYLHFSAIFIVLAYLTHPMVIFLLPLYLAIIFFKNKDKIRVVTLTLMIYLITFTLLNILLLSKVLNTNAIQIIQNLYFSKSGEFARLSFNLHSLLIVLRNFLIPLIQNNTSLIFILGLFSLLISFRKNKKIFVLGSLWILPALYANQWWDSLLNGRHALIAGFGLSFLTAYLIRKKIILALLVIIYLLFVSLPIMNLLKKPIPYLQEAEVVKQLPKGSLVIESHFARPQVQDIKSVNIIFINEPGLDNNNLKNEIDKYLAINKPVFISSAALSEPYGLYSGPYLHNITLSYAKPFDLESIINQFTLEKYKVINIEDNLLIYKIKSNHPSPYPPIKKLQNSKRSLDHSDPLTPKINF